MPINGQTSAVAEERSSGTKAEAVEASLNHGQPGGRIGETPASEPLPTPSDPILDHEQLHTLDVLDPDGSKDVLRRLIIKFADYGDEVVEEMTGHLLDDDISEVSRLAHSLKSTSASFGAVDLSSRCQLIETTAKNHGRAGEIAGQFEELTKAYQTVRQVLLDMVEGMERERGR
ncbi:MAG: Hpt domain-containing protein [Geminicoccaceae bacterium]